MAVMSENTLHEIRLRYTDAILEEAHHPHLGDP
jgi:hypothetical protein